MNHYFAFLLSQFVLVPVFIGLIRIKRLNKTYYPFFILLIVGFLTEVISFIFINKYKSSNFPIVNIYELVECCLILYQFHLWGNKKTGNLTFVFLTSVCVLIWVIEYIAFSNLNTFSPFFRVFYAFIIVLLSINQINALMVKPDGLLIKSPRFLLSLAFIVFFIYQIIYLASLFVGMDKSIIARKIVIGFDYINLAVNILFAVVVFLVTEKDKTVEVNYFSEH